MSRTAFADLYDKLTMPVVACGRDGDHQVVFLNAAARFLLVPGLSGKKRRRRNARGRWIRSRASATVKTGNSSCPRWPMPAA